MGVGDDDFFGDECAKEGERERKGLIEREGW